MLAQSMRVAGIASITIGDKHLVLRPIESAKPSDVDIPVEIEQSSDPLYDASTYAGGRVPGYQYTDEEPEDETE